MIIKIMKIKLLQQIVKMSRLLFFLTIVQCASFSLIFASNGHGQNSSSLKDIELQLSKSKHKILDIFKEIEKQSDLRFLIKSELVSPNATITIKSKNQTVWGVLTHISKETNLQFKRVGNTVVVLKKPSNLSSSLVKAIIDEAEIIITGIITDENGVGLPGVNVLVENSTLGTVTDVDGKYTLTVPENAIIQFSYIGYITQTIPLNGQTVINISMTPDLQQLEEIVVLSYGTVKRSELTSAVAKVSSKEISQATVRTIGEALQGRAAGVNVTAVSGEPGAGLVINIRGASTLNSGQDVLYVVDGFPVNRIDDVNPADVASIEILKDASATAIYGSRAANGVILITTKTGQSEKIQVTFDSKVSLQEVSNIINMNNATNYARARNRALVNSGLSPQWSEEEISYMGEGTNWFDEIIREGRLSDHTISLNGKSGNYSFYSSFNYFKHEGIVKNSNFERFVFRINQSLDINKYVKVGNNFNISSSKARYIADRSLPRGIIYEAMIVDPLTPARYVREEDDTDPFGKIKGNEFSQFGGPLTDNWNPLAHLARQQTTNRGLRIFGNAYIEVEPIEGLTFKSDLGLDLRRNEDTGFNPLFFIKINESDEIGQISKDNSTANNYVWTNTISYNKKFGNLKLTSVVGTVAEKYRNRWHGVSRQGLTSNDPNFQYLSVAEGVSASYGGESNSALNSYFGRAILNYDDRYMLSTSVRSDGSSKFAEGNKWGVFPAISVGWNLTNEAFMEGVADTWLSSLKMRVGWGKIGNASIPDGSTLSTVGPYAGFWGGNNYSFGTTPQLAIGISPLSPGNVALTWETSVQTNFGLDVYLFENKLSLTADYFIKTTTDLLLVEPLPTIGGYQNAPWSNAGEIRNRGFELLATYKDQVGDFGYNFTATFATLQNEIISIGRGDFISSGSFNGLDDVTRSQVGSSIGQFFGYQVEGIFQNNEEINAHSVDGNLIQPLAEPGDVRFADLDGNGVIDNDDKTFIGSPIPDFSYSLNVGLTYKKFDLNAFFQGVYGNEIVNGVKVFTNYGDGVKNLQDGVLDKAWNGEGTSNTHPRLVANDLNQNSRVSSLYVEDGSYLRLQNVQLGYNFSKSLIKKIGATNLRVYASVQNLFTLTNYTGIDPELASYSPLSTGIDYTVYPKARTYALGVNLTF